MIRRLAAILAADVVGYSRLMGEDEEGTLARVKSNRETIIEPEVASRGGRVVKLMGDGILVEFPSVVDAVACGLAIQEQMAGDTSQGLALRIGINLGDIIVEDDDIFGDGVNVATRLEGLAQTGGLCISDLAYQTVRSKFDVVFEDLGEQALKNIGYPVRAWRLKDERTSADSVHSAGPTAQTNEPSIAVLPFENMSVDAEQEYFADGITEDIISRLGRCRWLRVVARNSTFAYKGQSVDVRVVADELGAKFVLEGSVRRSGSRFRVTAQLLDGRNGSQLWSQQFDRNLEDIFDLQDEITSIIAGTIEPELEMLEGSLLRNRPAVALDAWDCYQRALWHLYHFTVDELESASSLLKRAIELDVNFAQAYARLAYVHIQFGWYGATEDRAANINEARRLANLAVSLDDRDPAARLSLGRALTLSGQIERGVEELRAALDLNPSFAQAHFALGQALCYLGHHEEALRQVDEALRLSPRDPHVWTFLHVRGMANYQAGNFVQTELDERAALRQPNKTHWPFLNLIAALSLQGKQAAAKLAIDELHRLRPGYGCADCRREFYFGEHRVMSEQYVEQLVGDLRSAGLPD